MSFHIIGMEDVMEENVYITISMDGAIWAMGPFDTPHIALENIKRMITPSEPDQMTILDAVWFLGIAQFTKLDLLRYDIALVSGDVFAEKLPWESK